MARPKKSIKQPKTIASTQSLSSFVNLDHPLPT
jgi:hypothetical protein